jgi:hypothetical protein
MCPTSKVLPLLNFLIDFTLQVNCCMGYTTWICYIAFFYTWKSLLPGCEAIHTQAYSFHKAGSPLRLAYASSCFGQVCYVTHGKLCFCYWISDSYSYDCDMVVHCWRMGLVASSFCFVVFYLFCNVQTQLACTTVTFRIRCRLSLKERKEKKKEKDSMFMLSCFCLHVPSGISWD